MNPIDCIGPAYTRVLNGEQPAINGDTVEVESLDTDPKVGDIVRVVKLNGRIMIPYWLGDTEERRELLESAAGLGTLWYVDVIHDTGEVTIKDPANDLCTRAHPFNLLLVYRKYYIDKPSAKQDNYVIMQRDDQWQCEVDALGPYTDLRAADRACDALARAFADGILRGREEGLLQAEELKINKQQITK